MSTSVAPAAFADGPLSLFPKLLREPRRPWLAIIVAWLLCILPSVALAAAVQGLAPQLGMPEFPLKGHAAFFAIAIFAPVVETFILAAIVSTLRLIFSPTATVILSAIGWGVAHSLQAAAWGFVVWWPFLIMSMLYLVWRQRSIWLALAIPAAVHILQNSGPGYLVAYGA